MNDPFVRKLETEKLSDITVVDTYMRIRLFMTGHMWTPDTYGTKTHSG